MKTASAASMKAATTTRMAAAPALRESGHHRAGEQNDEC
jgi:hypothetical protein